MPGDARLALAFTAGMLATVNPCALPMLPAYLGWFITGDDDRQSSASAVGRAAVVAVAVALGFVTVFGVLGLVATAASAQVERVTPWVTPWVGLALVAVGVALALGRTVKLPLPRLDRGGQGRGLAAMYGYGASYAVVSVSCALPIFLVHVSTTFGQSWATGLGQLAAFGAGFGLVLVALSMSVALTRGSLTGAARRAIPYVSRASGLLLVLSGAYLVWYGVNEIRLGRSGPTGDPLIRRVTGWSADLQVLAANIGAVELGLGLGLVIALVALVALVRSGKPASSRRPSRPARPASATKG